MISPFALDSSCFLGEQPPPSKRRKLNSTLDETLASSILNQGVALTNRLTSYLQSDFTDVLTNAFKKGGHSAAMQKIKDYSLDLLLNYSKKSFLGCGAIHFAIATKLPLSERTSKIFHLKEAIRLYGQTVPEEIFFELAECYRNSDTIEEAEKFFIKLPKTYGKPIPYAYLSDLAKHKLKLGKLEEAEIYFDRLIEQSGVITPLHCLELAALVQLRREAPETAIEILDFIQTNSLMPMSRLALYIAMKAYSLLGGYERAKHYLKALEATSSDPLPEYILLDAFYIYAQLGDMKNVYSICFQRTKDNPENSHYPHNERLIQAAKRLFAQSGNLSGATQFDHFLASADALSTLT